MRYDPKIHSISHLAKSFIGRAEKLFSGLSYDPKELLVVNYHSTPKKFIPNFIKQIDFLKANFNIIAPQQLADFYAGNHIAEKCSLLITFDDGLKNNLLAAEVLNRKGLKAMFFVVPDFISKIPEQQKDYYIKNIRTVINYVIDSNDEDFQAMNVENIMDLVATGHAIGSHTYTHTLNARNSDQANSEKEIVKSKQFLSTTFGVEISAYCSINNTLESTGKKEKQLIKDNYSFHFTTLPGFNKDGDRLFIKRRNIESHWLQGTFFYALGKWDIGRWKKRINEYIKL